MGPMVNRMHPELDGVSKFQLLFPCQNVGLPLLKISPQYWFKCKTLHLKIMAIKAQL